MHAISADLYTSMLLAALVAVNLGYPKAYELSGRQITTKKLRIHEYLAIGKISQYFGNATPIFPTLKITLQCLLWQ